MMIIVRKCTNASKKFYFFSHRTSIENLNEENRNYLVKQLKKKKIPEINDPLLVNEAG